MAAGLRALRVQDTLGDQGPCTLDGESEQGGRGAPVALLRCRMPGWEGEPESPSSLSSCPPNPTSRPCQAWGGEGMQQMLRSQGPEPVCPRNLSLFSLEGLGHLLLAE